MKARTYKRSETTQTAAHPAAHPGSPGIGWA